jgi:Na+/H+ antiporter NhaD/arsenite permease-like protein
VSIGGTLTQFAAPPVLMVADAWGWSMTHMLFNFGWKAALAIVISVIAYALVFKKDLAKLMVQEESRAAREHKLEAIPLWVTLGHLLFLVFAVWYSHDAPYLLLGLLFFLAFVEVTADFQRDFSLRSPLLVGFFLAGLIIHGGLQQWWIAPVLGRLSEVPLFLGATFLTAFNDNAAITYLATLVPGFSDSLKYAVVAGAVTGGGLTVIANAPNPAGQSILNKHFEDGISAAGLLIGALIPTVIAALCFMLLR